MTPLIEKLAEEYSKKKLSPEVFAAAQKFRDNAEDEQTVGVIQIIEKAAFIAGAKALLQALSKEAGDEPTQDEIKDHAIEFLHRIGTTWGTEQAYRKGFEQASLRWAAKVQELEAKLDPYVRQVGEWKIIQRLEEERDELKAKAEQNMQGWIDERADRKEIEKERDELKQKLAEAELDRDLWRDKHKIVTEGFEKMDEHALDLETKLALAVVGLERIANLEYAANEDDSGQFSDEIARQTLEKIK